MKKKNKKVNKERLFYVGIILVYVYLVGACIFKYFKTNNIRNSSPELFFILVLSCLIGYYVSTKEQRQNKLKKLFSVTRKNSKKERIKYYKIESLFISLMITTSIFVLIAIDVFNINFYKYFTNATFGIFLTLTVTYIICFILVFIFDYLVNEKLLRKVKIK